MTCNATLDAACVDCAKALLVAPRGDDSAALMIPSARQFNLTIAISARVRVGENEDLLSQASASSTINPMSLGGHLLQRSSTHRGAVDYIRELAAADGRIALLERPVTAAEVGRSLRAIGPGLGVRFLRQGKPIGFWDVVSETIEVGNAIIEIVAVGKRHAAGRKPLSAA